MALMPWPVVAGMMGLIAGSFIALLTWRWPRGEGVGGRSRCDQCGTTLGWAELVPVVSALVKRGRCRHCGGAIASRHLGIELVAALIGALLAWRWPGLSGLGIALAGWWLLALIITDVEHHWLPDALTLPLIPLALLLGWWLPGPALAERALAAIIGFAALEGLRRAYRALRGRDGMGGGDPRLMAGLGALLGPWLLPFLLLGASVLGLGLAGWDRARGRPVSGTTRLPFGALLAATAIILLILRPALP